MDSTSAAKAKATPTDPQAESDLVIDYMALRKAIGWMGMALPFVVALGATLLFRTELQSSISAYYHTGMRNVLVGTLCAIGTFLFAYLGYDRMDRWVGRIAGGAALGIALFPTPASSAPAGQEWWVGVVHWGSAVVFFLSIAHFSWFQFTKGQPGVRASAIKFRRNQVYRGCALTITAALALLGLHMLLPEGTRQRLAPIKPVFWLETAAVVAFGYAWLIKGQFWLRDR